MTYKERILDDLRKELSSGKRGTVNFRVDLGIAKNFKKMITRDRQIGKVIEELMLTYVSWETGKLKR